MLCAQYNCLLNLFNQADTSQRQACANLKLILTSIHDSIPGFCDNSLAMIVGVITGVTAIVSL